MQSKSNAEFVRTCSLIQLKKYLRGKRREDLPVDEQDALYKRMHESAVKGGVPVVIPQLQIQVIDKAGKIKRDTFVRPSYSSCRNYYNWGVVLFDQAIAENIGTSKWADSYFNFRRPQGTVVKAAGVGNDANPDTGGYGYRNGNNSVSGGIKPGTGTTVEDFSNFALASVTPHGSGTTLLNYGTTIRTLTFFDATVPYVQNKWERHFLNDGSTIIVREMALNYTPRLGGIGTGIVFLRDKLTTGVTVAADEVMIARYIFQMNYPSGV